MLLLNLGCGDVRPGPPWINMDSGGTGRGNYVAHDASQPWFFDNGTFDGIFCGHMLEHFESATCVRILKEAHRCLKKDGCFRAVVPDASYFRKVHMEDRADPYGNAVRLYGEQLNSNVPGHPHFMNWALFFDEHRQIFTEDSLWCSLVQAGFGPTRIYKVGHKETGEHGHYCSGILAWLDNRPLFSLRMEAMKEK